MNFYLSLAAWAVAGSAFAADLYVSGTKAEPPGLYLVEESADGTPGTRLAAAIPGVGFFKFSADGRHVYAIARTPGQKRRQSVFGFFVGPGGELTPTGSAPIEGRGACCLDVTPDGRAVLIANYGDGSVEALAVDTAGDLAGSIGRWRHNGSGPDERRQRGPHAHAFRVTPEGLFAFAPDLGADRVFLYGIGEDAFGSVEIDPLEVPSVATPPGSGPRHVAFHPTARLAFVTYELTAELGVFRITDDGPVATQTIATSPPVDGPYNNAEVRVSPDGRFVYVSNRGHDSLAVFAVDADRNGPTGTVTLVTRVPTGGHWPRHFSVSPDGTQVVVGNLRGDVVTFFDLGADGVPVATDKTLAIGGPICVQFRPAE